MRWQLFLLISLALRNHCLIERSIVSSPFERHRTSTGNIQVRSCFLCLFSIFNPALFFALSVTNAHESRKSTVFGRIVSGDDVLRKLEAIPTDSTDRPLRAITIRSVAIFGDPYDAYKLALTKRLVRQQEGRDVNGEKARKREERNKDRTTWMGTKLADKVVDGPVAKDRAGAAVGNGQVGGVGPNEAKGVGKYLKRKDEGGDGGTGENGTSKKLKAAGGFGSFDSW